MEDQPETVDAVAQSGRLGTVVEDVAEMAAAAPAMHLGPEHAKGAILGLADIALDRLVEARPARAALEFGVGGEQRQVAAGAGEDALAVLLEQRAGARPLGALLAQDLILLRGELGTPFGVRLLDLEFLRGFLSSLRGRCSEPAEGRKAEQAGDGRQQDAAVKHLILHCGASTPWHTGSHGRRYTSWREFSPVSFGSLSSRLGARFRTPS